MASRNFKGIWIPAEVWLHPDLSIQEKVLLAEIDSLEDKHFGCWASNEYFGKFFNLKPRRIQELLNSLESKSLIYKQFKESKKGTDRVLRVYKQGVRKKTSPHAANDTRGVQKRTPNNKLYNKPSPSELSSIIDLDWMPDERYLQDINYSTCIPIDFIITDCLPGFCGHNNGQMLSNPIGELQKWCTRQWSQYGGREKHSQKKAINKRI